MSVPERYKNLVEELGTALRTPLTEEMLEGKTIPEYRVIQVKNAFFKYINAEREEEDKEFEPLDLKPKFKSCIFYGSPSHVEETEVLFRLINELQNRMSGAQQPCHCTGPDCPCKFQKEADNLIFKAMASDIVMALTGEEIVFKDNLNPVDKSYYEQQNKVKLWQKATVHKWAWKMACSCPGIPEDAWPIFKSVVMGNSTSTEELLHYHYGDEEEHRSESIKRIREATLWLSERSLINIQGTEQGMRRLLQGNPPTDDEIPFFMEFWVPSGWKKCFSELINSLDITYRSIRNN